MLHDLCEMELKPEADLKFNAFTSFLLYVFALLFCIQHDVCLTLKQ